jgi:hypothetical protein
MKKLMKLLGFLLFFAALSSCADDETSENPCDDIICLNDGVCNGAGCNCPEGFTGGSCETRLAPRSIQITKITIKEFSNTDNANSWDANGGAPDVYFTMLNDNGTAIIYEQDVDTRFENAVSPTTLVVPLSTPIIVNNPSDSYNFILLDYDTFDADDLIGGFLGKLYFSGTTFDKVVEISFNGTTIEFELEYNF